MQNYVYFIKQKPNKDLGYFGECFIISASHLCACEDGIITSRNNNQIKDLGYFGECFIISASHLCACEDGIITSRNNNQIKDLGYFGEHCITALGDSSRLALVV